MAAWPWVASYAAQALGNPKEAEYHSQWARLLTEALEGGEYPATFLPEKERPVQEQPLEDWEKELLGISE